MNTPTKLTPLLATITVALLCTMVAPRAETVRILTYNFQISNPPPGVGFSFVLGSRWGLWNGSGFVQAVTGAANTGRVQVNENEIFVNMNQTNNSVYSEGTQLSLAIYGNENVNNSEAVDYATAAASPGFWYAILTDPSWTAPTFADNTTLVNFNFTPNTTAQAGGYTVNEFSESVITLVPEPSTYALLALSATAFGGYALRRRHRS